jgi:hypothetical protein
MRLEMLEIPFLRLMHTVAHHPDMQDFDAEVPPTHEDVEGEGGEGNPANTKFDTLHNLAGSVAFTMSLCRTLTTMLYVDIFASMLTTLSRRITYHCYIISRRS